MKGRPIAAHTSASLWLQGKKEPEAFPAFSSLCQRAQQSDDPREPT